MAPKIDVGLWREEYEAITKQISNIIIRSDENLIKLGKKKCHLVQLINKIQNKIEKISATERPVEVKLLLEEIWDSISGIDDTESEWEKSKLNDSRSSDGKPEKKKSKIEEFEDAVIECDGNYARLASRASAIINDQEKDIKRVKFERDVAVAKLNLRPLVVKLEENIIPGWLHMYGFPIKLKLVISIQFQLTLEAAVLSQRCAKSKPAISIERVAKVLCLVYRKSSKEINHNDNPGAVILTDEQWNIIFKDIEITEPLDQEAVKLALRFPDRTEFNGIEKEEQKEMKYTYILYVNELSIDFNLGIEAAKDRIIKVCGSEYENDFNEFYFPDPNGEDYRREMFFTISNRTQYEMKQIKGKLLNCQPTNADRVVSYEKIVVYHS